MAARDPNLSNTRRRLGEVFTRSEALRSGLTPHRLYLLRDLGKLVALGGGVFRWADAKLADLDLLEIAERVPQATLCLDTALARHSLIDAIPSAVDVAIPRGNHRPRLNAPIQLHHFDPKTFQIGRDTIDVGARTRLGLYSPERSLIDAVRLGYRYGSENAWEALRRWLRRQGASPARLITMAKQFNGAEAPLRRALDVLQ